MKVYGVPKDVPFSEPDFRHGYNHEEENARITAHQDRLRVWLRQQGFKGKRTGEIVRFQVADGYAQYMLADGGAKSFLIHLPYGDAWQYRDVTWLPRAEIIRRIDNENRLAALFRQTATGRTSCR